MKPSGRKRPVFFCRCTHSYMSHVNSLGVCEDCRCLGFDPDRENYPLGRLVITS